MMVLGEKSYKKCSPHVTTYRGDEQKVKYKNLKKQSLRLLQPR